MSVPLTPLAILLTSPTPASVRATLVSGLIALRIPANQWRAGGVASSLLTVSANLLAGFAATLTSAISAAFLGTATGPWLVLLAYYVFGVTANPGTFATGSLTLTNTAGGLWSFPAGGVTAQNPITGQTYVSTQALSLAPMGTATIVFQSTTVGSGGSSAANQITTLVTAMTGVTVTNPAALVGLDADSDATVVAKCQAARAGRSYFGPSGAYYAAIYGTTNPSTGLPLDINRIRVVNVSDMAVGVYVASPSGAPTPSDLAAAQTAVTAAAQPMNVTAQVYPCTVVSDARPITVWAQTAPTAAGSDVATIEEEALDAIDEYYSAYPIGGLARPPSPQGYLFASAVSGVLKGADPLIFDVQGVTSDLALTAGQVVIYTGTITTRQVSAS
jgi:Baseplate J-like protein